MVVKEEGEEVLLSVVKTSGNEARNGETISKQRPDRAIFPPFFCLSFPGNPSGQRASSRFTLEFYASTLSFFFSLSFSSLDGETSFSIFAKDESTKATLQRRGTRNSYVICRRSIDEG